MERVTDNLRDPSGRRKGESKYEFIDRLVKTVAAQRRILDEVCDGSHGFATAAQVREFIRAEREAADL